MPSMTRSPLMVEDGQHPFDIVATYHALLKSDPDLTMPVAAIEALVALLAASPSLTTVSETLDVLNAASATLKRAVSNPISLSAGTDLFTRYIVTSLRPGAFPMPSSGSPLPSGSTHDDFQNVRAHLLNNARLFVARAKEARHKIACLAASFVRANSTVLTNGGSRAVGAVLREAAEQQTRAGGAPRFRVIYVTSPASIGLTATALPSSGKTTTGIAAAAAAEGAATIRALRALHVPVAEISEAAVAYAMDKVSLVLVGAEGVVENGGIISRLGTYQMAQLAKARRREVYVVAESHKFVRLFPLGQYDIGVEQRVIEFKTAADEEESSHAAGAEGGGDKTPRGTLTEYFDVSSWAARYSDAVDYTPPELLTALITEAGVLTTSAVSEELIKIWY